MLVSIPGPKFKNFHMKIGQAVVSNQYFCHDVKTSLNHNDGHFEFNAEEDDCDDEVRGDGLSKDASDYHGNMGMRDKWMDPLPPPPCLPGVPEYLGEDQKVICHPLTSKKPSKAEVDAYLAQKCDGRV